MQYPTAVCDKINLNASEYSYNPYADYAPYWLERNVRVQSILLSKLIWGVLNTAHSTVYTALTSTEFRRRFYLKVNVS